MFKLIYKEFRLAAHPTLFIFMLLGTLIIIPSYPYSVVFLFGCLGPFISFFYARETNDAFYTASLPVRKRDVVKGKVLMMVIAQIGQLLFSIPFAFLRLQTSSSPNPVGIEANVAYYGFGLISFAVFNYFFLAEYYKTAYKVGKAFIVGIIPFMIINLAMESLSHIPATKWLDGTSQNLLIKQLPILAAGIVIYNIGMIYTFKSSAKRFKHVDL